VSERNEHRAQSTEDREEEKRECDGTDPQRYSLERRSLQSSEDRRPPLQEAPSEVL